MTRVLHTRRRPVFRFWHSVRCRPVFPVPGFDFDNHAGTRQATQHLIATGHQRIALLSEDNSRAYVTARRQGWRDALSEHGLPETGYAGSLPPDAQVSGQ